MNIKQIIPATGWVVKHKQEDNTLFVKPLICFGIVTDEKTGEESIQGFAEDGDTGLIQTCEAENFAGYFREP
jgi:hypothetical protein